MLKNLLQPQLNAASQLGKGNSYVSDGTIKVVNNPKRQAELESERHRVIELYRQSKAKRS